MALPLVAVLAHWLLVCQWVAMSVRGLVRQWAAVSVHRLLVRKWAAVSAHGWVTALDSNMGSRKSHPLGKKTYT